MSFLKRPTSTIARRVRWEARLEILDDFIVLVGIPSTGIARLAGVEHAKVVEVIEQFKMTDEERWLVFFVQESKDPMIYSANSWGCTWIMHSLGVCEYDIDQICQVFREMDAEADAETDRLETLNIEDYQENGCK